MARITVEDCLKQLDNRFGLIHLAAKRVRQLRKGSEPMVVCKNKDIVVSLREIASGKVYKTEAKEDDYLIENPEETVQLALQAQNDEKEPSAEDQESEPEK
jgi:DNA-directed RNA polymerase subunit omega